VTFMKIDVADIEARLSPIESSSLDSLVNMGKRTKKRVEQAAELLLGAETIAFSLTFLQGGGFKRFLEGTRQSFEEARKADIITESEYDTIWRRFEQTITALDERGAKKGDRLLYRVETDRVLLGYIGIDGDLLIETLFEGDHWARGIKGSFLGPDSRFRDKLIRSLWRKQQH